MKISILIGVSVPIGGDTAFLCSRADAKLAPVQILAQIMDTLHRIVRAMNPDICIVFNIIFRKFWFHEFAELSTTPAIKIPGRTPADL
jgi:hypothetical protein